jgi:hypothetical protein
MIGAAIYTILSGNVGVSALIGTRIYPDIAPQNAAYPFAIYTVNGTDPTDTKDGVSPMDLVDLGIVVYSETYDSAQTIARAIRTALDAKAAGTYGGVSLQSIRFAGQRAAQMELDKHVYIVDSSYNIRVNGG